MGDSYDFFPNDQYPAGAAFKASGIFTFQQACNHVRNLPFLRTSSRDDFTLVLKEQRGTCSAKHGLLKQLAEENNINEWKLFTCVYNMDAVNTPKIKEVLINNQLQFFPETHCYLKFNGVIHDFTFPEDTSAVYKHATLMEFELCSADIKNSKNLDYYFEHLHTLQKKELTDFSLDDLMAIRTACWEKMAS